MYKTHFAKLNSENIIMGVVPFLISDGLDENGNFDETIAINKLIENDPDIMEGETYLRCSRDGSIRKNSASIGGSYDSANDAFLLPKPYPSWILNERTFQWVAPIEKPNPQYYTDNIEDYVWNEETVSWDLISSVSE